METRRRYAPSVHVDWGNLATIPEKGKELSLPLRAAMLPYLDRLTVRRHGITHGEASWNHVVNGER